MARMMGPAAPDTTLILASGSAIRAQLLRGAGLDFVIEAAPLDEAEIRLALQAEGASAGDTAIALAEAKALRISRKRPGALVIGCDQMLDCNGVWFEKPGDRDHARAHLQALRGRDHTLLSGVVVACDGQRIWHHLSTARLTVRPLSADFIEAYLEAAGEAVLNSVGAYQLEGLGAQLFSRIEGDYFTILGLPLLPLLDFLRLHSILKR
jgi:septum formation protein